MTSNKAKDFFTAALSLLLVLFQAQASEAAPSLKCKNYLECKALFESTAKHLLGSHYAYGSKSSQGFDCSGLVLTMVNTLVSNNSLPRSSQDMYRALNQSVALDQARTGDLLFFNTGRGVSHVGLYWGKDAKGNHIMYHSSTSKGVEMRTLNGDKYWMSHFVGAKRFLPVTQALSTDSKPTKALIQAAETSPANGSKASKENGTENKDKKSKQLVQDYKSDELNEYVDYYYEEVAYEDDMYQTSYAPESNRGRHKTYYEPEYYSDEYEYELSYR